jgi:hypothetical protein
MTVVRRQWCDDSCDDSCDDIVVMTVVVTTVVTDDSGDNSGDTIIVLVNKLVFVTVVGGMTVLIHVLCLGFDALC